MSPEDDIVSAARIIYLTTLSFNGIYRTNLKGKFNVPYGRKTHINPCDSLKILDASKILSVAEILCADFSDITETATVGDIVYFDPPYTVSHSNNGFIKYNSKIFSWDDQLRLANISNMLVQRGCRVIISNAYHPSVLHLYKGFNTKIVQRFSIISASSDFRRVIQECIFYN
jgi:DNA adenine methylase